MLTIWKKAVGEMIDYVSYNAKSLRKSHKVQREKRKKPKHKNSFHYHQPEEKIQKAQEQLAELTGTNEDLEKQLEEAKTGSNNSKNAELEKGQKGPGE